MIDRIKQITAKNSQEILDIRRHLHANPELSFKEFETSKYEQTQQTTQLGVTKILTLDENKLAKLKEDPLYVNIHSTDHASGLMRGQIR